MKAVTLLFDKDTMEGDAIFTASFKRMDYLEKMDLLADWIATLEKEYRNTYDKYQLAQEPV